MSSFASRQKSQDEAAASRLLVNEASRQRNSQLVRDGALIQADDPIRIASRIDRLSRYYSDVRPVDAAALAAEDPETTREAERLLERVIHTADFMGVAYLEAGMAAEQSVGRVNVRDQSGRLLGYGTGFMVSPRLFLTNNHVVSTKELAGASSVEFNYEDDPQGRIRKPSAFGLEPSTFFLTSEELDFTLVAVRAAAGELAEFGFNRLIPEEGKAIIGDFVTIVQHPGGEKKQVALRENRIVDLPDTMLHYSTDTEPGSSGSPVFNDQWEAVALHHASVSAPQHEELGGIVNEGIRVSRLVTHITEQGLTEQEQAYIDEMLTVEAAPPFTSAVASDTTGPTTSIGPSDGGVAGTIRLQIPLEVSVDTDAKPSIHVGSQLEAITIDPDYSTRGGYDPKFLGSGEYQVALPKLSEDLIPLAAVNAQATLEPDYVLDYHHYSVVHNKERRLAFLTAVNIDGATHYRQSLPRESDRWYYDPRIPEDQQAGEKVYAANPLDRGHLVRRLDPGWGDSQEIAKRATDDTFHFTNCSPQHERFNQNRSTWAGLEDYLLYNADNFDFKASVFTGPVFADDDQEFNDIQLPRQYWKVAVIAIEAGLSATGYLLSQEELIRGLEFSPEEFSYGAYSTFQVAVSTIQEMTKLDFGILDELDPLAQAGYEAASAPREITRPQDLVLEALARPDET